MALRRKWPNLQFEADLVALDAEGVRWYEDNFDIHSEKEYLKHMLNKHDGEARLVGDPSWEEFPASGGPPFEPRFWHCQYMKDPETRKYMQSRTWEAWAQDRLTVSDAKWIL